MSLQNEAAEVFRALASGFLRAAEVLEEKERAKCSVCRRTAQERMAQRSQSGELPTCPGCGWLWAGGARAPIAKEAKPVLARWGIWLKNVGAWRTNGSHRSVFAIEADARREAGAETEARLLPLDEPIGEPVCPRCERAYGSPHSMGCSMTHADDNGFGDGS